MVVSASEPVHREVGELLKVLREPPKDSVKAEDMMPEQIAEVDQEMAKHLQARQEIALRIEQLKLQKGEGSSPAVKATEDLLKIRDQLIADRADHFRQKYKGFRFTPNTGMHRGPNATAEEVRKAEEKKLWDEKCPARDRCFRPVQ